MSFDRDQVKRRVSELAASGVYIGTSSWKYQGWIGNLYSPARYEKPRRTPQIQAEQGFFPDLQIEVEPKSAEKIDERHFEAECLREYAEVFKTVSVDATYYAFPTRESLQALGYKVSEDFQFGLKVTNAVTMKSHLNHPSQGINAGRFNKNFLDADLFADAFLSPCEAIRQKVGVLMFEFSRFESMDYRRWRTSSLILTAFSADCQRAGLTPSNCATRIGWCRSISIV